MFSFSRTIQSTACMIDDRFIRFFSIEKNGKRFSLKNFFSERIPDEVYEENGQFINAEHLVSRLREIRSKLRIANIHLVVPDTYITVFHTVVAHDVFRDKKDFRKAVEDYLSDLLVSHEDFSENDAIADYDILEETPEGYHIHVAIARPEYFQHLPQLFESAGFTIEHIDISSFALHRIAKAMHDQEVYGMISIGTHTTNISVVRSGNIIASTTVSVGGEHLITTLQETLQISRSEAEKIIHQYGILHSHPDKNVLSNLFMKLKPVVQGIEQVKSACSEEYYEHGFYHIKPEYFYLYGIGVSISGIAQYLGIKTNTIVRPIDVIPFEFIDEEILLQIPVELVPLYLPVMSTAIHYLAE